MPDAEIHTAWMLRSYREQQEIEGFGEMSYDERRQAVIRVREQKVQSYKEMVNAPHTALAVTADEWTHPYSRQQAAYPAPGQLLHKFWPGCSRVDNTYGDRNFCCCCDTLAQCEL